MARAKWSGRVTLLPRAGFLRLLYVFWKLPTYPSAKPTLTLTSHFGQNVGLRAKYWLRGGEGGQFPRNVSLCKWGLSLLAKQQLVTCITRALKRFAPFLSLSVAAQTRGEIYLCDFCIAWRSETYDDVFFLFLDLNALLEPYCEIS